MSGVIWKNLATQTKVVAEDAIALLTKADVGSDIFTMDEMVIKESLFNCMKKFIDNPEVQRRSIQHLQDCQILSQKGVTSDELAFRFDTLLLALSNCMDRTDVVCNLFEFLAMVADRKAVKERCSRTEETELLHYVGHTLEIHQKDKSVQRAGLQLYEAILLNASEKSQRVFAKKIFRAVGENLQRNHDDPAICFSSYSILCTLTDKMGDKLAPWIERILGMILTTVTQLFSAELVAKCMLLLEQMATDEDALYVMAAHPRCLLVFTDALGILGVTYLGACITALEYMLRILEEDTAMHIVSENLKDQNQPELAYFLLVQSEMRTKSEKFLTLVKEASEVDHGAVEYWQQLVDFITNIVDELVAERRLREGIETPTPAAAIEPVAAPTPEPTASSLKIDTTASSLSNANNVNNNALGSKNSSRNSSSGDLGGTDKMGGTNPMLQIDTKKKSSRNMIPIPPTQGQLPQREESQSSETDTGRGRAHTVVAQPYNGSSPLNANVVIAAAAGPTVGIAAGVTTSTARVAEAPLPLSTSSMHGSTHGSMHGSRHGKFAPDGIPGSVRPNTSHITWDTLEDQTESFVVETFLQNSDVGMAVMTQDPMIIKGALFGTMMTFETEPDILHRCLQLLQDCQILSPKGVTNDEMAFRFDQLLQLLNDQLERADVVCVLFEFLAMVADRKAVKERCARTENTELLHYVGQALEFHRTDKLVQRAGLQLYEAILLHASEKSQKLFAKKIFRTVGENLSKNNDDPAICFSSYSILCTLTDKMGDKLAPWIERILGLVLSSITQLFSAELVAKCLLLLEKIAVDHDSLFVMAAHPRCLLVYTDALGILDPKYMSATITALEYLLRILEDDTSMSVVLENLDEQKLTHLEYFQNVQTELAAKSDKFLDLTAQAGEIDDGAMQYWLQLLEQINNILVEFMRELNKDAAEIIQAAVTPGLLPTIEEHGPEDEDEDDSSDSDVEVYNEKDDDSLGHLPSPMVRALSRANKAAMKLNSPRKRSSRDVQAEQNEINSIFIGSSDGSPTPGTPLSAEKSKAEKAEAERLAQEAAEMEAYKVAQAAAEAEEEAFRLEQAAAEEEAKRLAEEAAEAHRLQEEEEERENYRVAQAAAEAEDEAYRLELAAAAAAAEALRLQEEAAQEEIDRVAREAAEAEERRVADEEEAYRVAQAEAEAEALRLAQEAEEQEAYRVAQAAAEEEERRLAAEEEALLVAQAEAEAEALRLAQELEDQEAYRIAQEAAEEEERRLAEEEENYRVAQAEAEAEALRLAEEAEEQEAYRIAQAAAEAEAEELRLAEEAEAERLAQEAAEAQRLAEEEEEREAYRVAQAAAEAEAEALRLEEEAEAERIALEEAEAQRLADEAEQEAYRLAQEAAEAEEARLAEELEAQRLAAEAEAQRIAEEEEQEAYRIAQAEAEAEALRVAEEEAQEAYRIAQAEAEAEELRLAEEEEIRRAEEAAAEELRLAEEAEAFRIAQERDAAEAERLAAAQRERLAAAAAAAEKAETDRQAALQLKREREAEAMRIEAERRAAEKARAAAAAEKAEQDRLAALRLHQELQKQREIETARIEAERKAVIDAQKARVAAAAAAAEKAEIDRQAALLLKHERELEAARRETERLAAIEAEKVKAAAAIQRQKEREIEAERLKQERKAAMEAEALRISAARKAERERIAAEKAAEVARVEAERREAREVRARVLELERAEKQRVAAERAAELERQIAARREAEAKVRERANALAAEKSAANQAAAKLAAEKAAARVAAEKEAERERAALRLAERDARLAAAEQTKVALLAQRRARLDAEKLAADNLAARRAAEQRERDERAANEKAERHAAAQLAMQEAQERVRREREIAQNAHKKEVSRLEALRQAAEEKRLASEASPSPEHKASPKTSSSHNVASDIANEEVSEGVQEGTSELKPSTTPLGRNSSWKSDKVPFLRKSEQVAAQLAPIDVNFVEESEEIAQLKREAEESRKQAAEAVQRANALHELYQGAEKKAEGLLSANSRLLQIVNDGSFTPALPISENQSTFSPAPAPSGAAPKSATSKGYSSVLMSRPGNPASARSVPSPSPVRGVSASARTPQTNSANPRMGAVNSAQSAQSGYFEMDSVNFDLSSPSPQAVSQRRLSHSNSVPTFLPSQPAAPLPANAQSAEIHHSTSTPALRRDQSPSPFRQSLTSPGDKSRDLTQSPNRQARSERLSRIHYPKGRASPTRRSSLKAPEDTDSKQSQAIDGILEAFAQLTVPSTKVLHISNVPHNSLHTDSAPNSPLARSSSATSSKSNKSTTSRGRSQSPQRRTLGEMETLYNEVVAASKDQLMLECGNNVAALFRRLKESTKNHQDAGKQDMVVSLPLVKACIKKLGLLEETGFGVNEVQIVLSGLGVKQLTLFGFGYALTTCAERFLRCSLASPTTSSGITPPVPLVSYLAVVEVLNDKVIRQLERVDAELKHRSAFNPLDDYKEIAPEEQVEVMKLLEREKKVFFTIYKSYLPSITQGFSDIKIALAAAPFSGGLPFSGIVNFSRDFEISPELLSRPQLLEIFESVLQAEKELMESKKHSVSEEGKQDLVTSGFGASKGLTKLADAKSDSISFPQFLDLVLLIALRCPMFRGPSPAFVKLSNLLLLMNRSKGRSKIEQKFRWKELVVFKVNPVFAVAAIVQNNTQKAVAVAANTLHHYEALEEKSGSVVSAGSEQDSIEQNSAKLSQSRLTPVKTSATPSAGLISVSPRANTRNTKPTTVPYYDVESQAVVQIRRKKPMDELRNKFGEAN